MGLGSNVLGLREPLVPHLFCSRANAGPEKITTLSKFIGLFRGTVEDKIETF
jgi:hypothetical protein